MNTSTFFTACGLILSQALRNLKVITMNYRNSRLNAHNVRYRLVLDLVSLKLLK